MIRLNESPAETEYKLLNKSMDIILKDSLHIRRDTFYCL